MLLLVGFIVNADTAEAAGSVDIDGVFAFAGFVLALVRDATKNEAGSDLDLDVCGDLNINATKEAEGLDDGIFGEVGMTEVKVDAAEDSDEVRAGVCFVVVSTVTTRENGHLGVHDFVVFEVLNLLLDLFVVVVMKDAFTNDGDTDNNQEDGKDSFPSNVVRENVLSGKE